MAVSDTWTITLPNDLYEEAEEYRSDRGISNSEAGRRLIRQGLESSEGRSGTANTMLDHIAAVAATTAAVTSGMGATALYYLESDPAVWFAASVWSIVVVLGWLALTRIKHSKGGETNV